MYPELPELRGPSALTFHFIQFVVSEVPSNLLLKRFGTVILAITVIGFGLCTLGSAFVTSYDGLMVTRVFLGISEGGTLVRKAIGIQFFGLTLLVLCSQG